MLQLSNEEKVAGKQEKKMRKNDSKFLATPQAVLLQSSRHNLQSSISNHGATFTKGKSTSRKTDVVHTLNHVAGTNAKKSAVLFRCGEELSSNSCSPAKKAALDVQASANSSEIDELKQRLQDANLQIAEVVAQSAIMVRDMQFAASKEIAAAMQQLGSSSCLEEGDSNRFVSFNKGSSVSLLNTQVGRGFCHMGAHTSEQELASTRQELAECKLMIAEMRRQLERTSFEKEKLEIYLRSSVQTSLKLQDTLVNQKTVMQLELLAAEDRCRNEASLLVQSARNEAKHLRDQLNAALLSKEETDCSLRNCIQLLCHAQREQLMSTVSAKQQCCFQLAVQEMLQQLQNAQEQVKVERDNLHEAYAQNTIDWTVLECVWEGAVKSLLESGGSNVQEHSLHAETPGSCTKKSKKLSLQAQKYSWSGKEELTPLKNMSFLATPRLKISREEGLSLSEDILRQNLLKSEHEVEILGNKVGELRIILEKVTLLLDCISKSSVSGHEQTKILMRRIIEQLQTFELHQHLHELPSEGEATKGMKCNFN